MINTQKRDIQFSFAQVIRRPILSEIIDDAWRSEKLLDLDMIIPKHTIQNRLQDQPDEDMAQRVPIMDARTWNDNGMDELIMPEIKDLQNDMLGGTGVLNSDMVRFSNLR